MMMCFVIFSRDKRTPPPRHQTCSRYRSRNRPKGQELLKNCEGLGAERLLIKCGLREIGIIL